MTTATIQETQLTEFAERVYTEQKAHFVRDFAQHLKARIDSGLTQIKNGQVSSIDDVEGRLRKKYSNK